ncbi:MAG TPA: hypothetical protein VD884_12280 [Ohtaekwangia sp.]|nr:hypothetical protein [Ohtaekwangia sp.]
MKMNLRALIFLLILTIISLPGKSQQTVFTLFKNDVKLADQYMAEKNFQQALKLYKRASKKGTTEKSTDLKMARCYYFIKAYKEAVAMYAKYGENLPASDLYNVAEALCGMKEYQTAIDYYSAFLKQKPDDDLVLKKIWRLDNVQFLYEDSLHYAVMPISINSESSDLCAVPFQDGIVFMSNRKQFQIVDKIDATSNKPFYSLYQATRIQDTTTNGAFVLGKIIPFSKEINSRLHTGPVSFYNNGKKVVFALTSNESNARKERTSQLYFAEIVNGKWQRTISFPHNSLNHSISTPSMSEDGRWLYFSSDMKGGFGGSDIYRCEYRDGHWQKPANLGEQINTVHDEVFPYVHLNHILYFSSNGQAGLGGLDIFKTEIQPGGFGEVENAGYPINSNHDDFGISLDSMNSHGYFSSNRGKGGYHDDIYEFDMDVQVYPLEISGLIRYKEYNWMDSAELKLYANAKLALIDNVRQVTVYESTSDKDGNFTLMIPYFSKFKIRVTGGDNDENFVSLEIPKQRKASNKHEIVVVKDAFKLKEQQDGGKN